MQREKQILNKNHNSREDKDIFSCPNLEIFLILSRSMHLAYKKRKNNRIPPRPIELLICRHNKYTLKT